MITDLQKTEGLKEILLTQIEYLQKENEIKLKALIAIEDKIILLINEYSNQIQNKKTDFKLNKKRKRKEFVVGTLFE